MNKEKPEIPGHVILHQNSCYENIKYEKESMFMHEIFLSLDSLSPTGIKKNQRPNTITTHKQFI